MIGKRAAAIRAIEYWLPDRSETNTDLMRENPSWNMTAVASKTGVEARRVAAAGERASDLAVKACEKIFSTAGLDRSSLDALIYCTQSPDFILPTTACTLQSRLGLRDGIAAFDINLACSGYIYGLALCRALIESGMFKQILLVTADTYTKYIDPKDRATRSLFGDGACATWVGESAAGLGEFIFGTDGSGCESFIIPSRTNSGNGQQAPEAPYISMDGKAIFSFMSKAMPAAVARLVAQSGVPLDSIDLFVFHQASQFLVERLASRIGIPMEKVFLNLREIGNTVSSSIPMAIKDAETAGKLRAGDKVMLVGFGAGFSWGACVLEWRPDGPANLTKIPQENLF